MPKRKHLKKRQKRWLKVIFPVVFLFCCLVGGIIVGLNDKGVTPAYVPANHKLGAPLLRKRSPLEKASQEVHEPRDAKSAQIDQLLLSKNFSGTALIYHNGQIILNKSYGFKDVGNQITNTLSTQYCIGSIQKTQTAYLIAKQIAAGRLHFSDPLSKFFPQVPNSEHITIKDLLNMTTGLRMQPPPVQEMSATDPNAILKMIITRTTFVGNKKYSYQAVNYNLLVGILEQVTKTDYYQLFEKQITNTMQLEQTSFAAEKDPDQALPYSFKNGVSTLMPAPDAAYALELGTGNVFMSASDLFAFYQRFFSNYYLAQPLRTEMLQPYPGEKYASGNYNLTNYFHSRGVKITYEGIINYGANGQDCVILLSNRQDPTLTINKLSDEITQLIVPYKVQPV